MRYPLHGWCVLTFMAEGICICGTVVALWQGAMALIKVIINDNQNMFGNL